MTPQEKIAPGWKPEHGVRPFIVAGNHVQAEFWARYLGLHHHEWTYATSANVRGYRDVAVIYAGPWSTNPELLDLVEALVVIDGPDLRCGDDWEDENEAFLAKLAIRTLMAQRLAKRARVAEDQARADYETARAKRQGSY